MKTKAGSSQTELSVEDINKIRPAYLEIDLNALRHNFQQIKNRISADTSFMAVIKANAYGHGLIEIGLKAEEYGADLLGVAFIEEGERLLKAGIKIPIAVLYPDIIERTSRLVNAGMIAVVDSTEYLDALNKAAVSMKKKVKVFIKIETGMRRYGVDSAEIQDIITTASEMTGIEIIGVTTNLADSANGDNTFTESQFAEFTNAIKKTGLNIKDHYLSIENSSGFLFHHNQNFNLIRIGLLLYGIHPKKNIDIDIKPVMSLKSRIIRLKKLPAGKPVGYSGSFITKRDTTAATIGIGYADGYPWSLSNKGYVLINGYKAPIIGRICMDAMMIDVTEIPGVKEGDEVVLLGKSKDQSITANEIAELAGSFSYELISGFTIRLPRIYKGE
ncbi:MAG: alanine racemase [candidate division Zixibacteria bacterium]|nr:alanine racemase [candidate division Zixibacteria bacterium]